jgi:hypothetical protein
MRIEQIIKKALLLAAATGLMLSASAQTHPATTRRDRPRRERRSQVTLPNPKTTRKQAEFDKQLTKIEHQGTPKSAPKRKHENKVAAEKPNMKTEKNTPINFNAKAQKSPMGGHGRKSAAKRSGGNLLRRRGR